MTEEERLERQHLREELILERGWREIVVPVLRARLHEMEMRTMRAKTLEEVKNLQGAWTVLEMMLTRPLEFFGEIEER